MIDVYKYFDYVVCLNCIDVENYKGRRDFMSNQFLDKLDIDVASEKRFSFANMQRMPYIYDIVEKIKDDYICITDIKNSKKSDEAVMRSIDYTLNLRRIYKSLLEDGYKHVLFVEDDVAFLKDKQIIEDTFKSNPGYDLSLYDAYMNDAQSQFMHNTKRNEWWSDYAVLWNCDMFSLTDTGLDYMVQAINDKIAYPDFYTWCIKGTPYVRDINLEFPNTSYDTLQHGVSNTFLGIQIFNEKSSIHYNAKLDNVFVVDNEKYI